jgi:hypothetical protein
MKYYLLISLAVVCSSALPAQQLNSELTVTSTSFAEAIRSNGIKTKIDIQSMRPSLTEHSEWMIYDQYRQFTRRKKTGFWKGVATGALIGVGTGALIGLISGDDPKDQWFSMTAGEKALAGAIIFGSAGAVIGGVIAAINHRKMSPIPY